MDAPLRDRNAPLFPRSPAAPFAAGVGNDLATDSDAWGFRESPAFLAAGAASVLCWTGIAMALLHFV